MVVRSREVRGYIERPVAGLSPGPNRTLDLTTYHTQTHHGWPRYAFLCSERLNTDLRIGKQ